MWLQAYDDLTFPPTTAQVAASGASSEEEEQASEPRHCGSHDTDSHEEERREKRARVFELLAEEEGEGGCDRSISPPISVSSDSDSQ